MPRNADLPDTEFYNQLRPEQRVAVSTMCGHLFSMPQGGPGTGTTHTIARADFQRGCSREDVTEQPRADDDHPERSYAGRCQRRCGRGDARQAECVGVAAGRRLL